MPKRNVKKGPNVIHTHKHTQQMYKFMETKATISDGDEKAWSEVAGTATCRLIWIMDKWTFIDWLTFCCSFGGETKRPFIFTATNQFRFPFPFNDMMYWKVTNRFEWSGHNDRLSTNMCVRVAFLSTIVSSFFKVKIKNICLI